MFGDSDWCNIYHVCVGSRDNIFLCPPGTIFNETDQGCMNRFDSTNCNGTRSYYKPTMKRQKRDDMLEKSQTFAHLQQMPKENNDQIIPNQWKKFYQSKRVSCALIKYILFRIFYSFSLIESLCNGLKTNSHLFSIPQYRMTLLIIFFSTFSLVRSNILFPLA